MYRYDVRSLVITAAALLVSLVTLGARAEAKASVVIVPQTLTLSWDHDPGPYSFNVYESTNLAVFSNPLVLRTNTTQQSVLIPVQTGTHYFTVTCVDTNTGEESSLAVP
jgi:hypothetical protein